jgi:hypothetical protein
VISQATLPVRNSKRYFRDDPAVFENIAHKLVFYRCDTVLWLEPNRAASGVPLSEQANFGGGLERKGSAMRRLQISHVTEYRFPGPVSLLPHRLLLRSRENHNVRIESSLLEIFPAHTMQWKRDVLDNSVAVVAITQPTDLLRIASTVVIQHYDEKASIRPAARLPATGMLRWRLHATRKPYRRWLETLSAPRRSARR